MAVLGLLLIKFPGNSNYIHPALHYAEGGAVTDAINSFFLFAIGASMLYSFSKYDFSCSKQLAEKISKRVAVLFALGLAFNFLDAIITQAPRPAMMGDFQYAALAYGLAAALVLWLRRLRFLISASLLLMIACYQIFSFLPFPVVIVRVLHYMLVALAGYATITLCHGRPSHLLLSLGLFIVGLSCLLINRVLEDIIPLGTTGVVKLISYPWMAYACSMFLVDVCKWKKWAYPLMIFGRNALLVFVLSAVLSILFEKIILWTTPAGSTDSVLHWFYKHVCAALFGNNEVGSLFYAFVGALLMWLVAWLFYRRKIFIKV
jgi:predicted acyltransferase